MEAYKIDHVREAINGLAFCFQKIDVVPMEEMPKIFEDQDKYLVRPEEGNWVRIKTGLYQGDCGIVEKVLKSDKIVIKLIPRLDPNFILGRKVDKSLKNSFMKFPQKEFSRDQFQGRVQTVQPNNFNKTFLQVQGSQALFRKGFIYKGFPIK